MVYFSQPWFNLNVPWPARVYKICTLEFGFEVRWFHGTLHSKQFNMAKPIVQAIILV